MIVFIGNKKNLIENSLFVLMLWYIQLKLQAPITTFINVDTSKTFDEAVSATKLIYTKFYHELIMKYLNPRTLKKRFWEEEELSKRFEGHLVEMLHIMFDWNIIHKI